MQHEVLWNGVGVSAAAPHHHYVGWCGAATGDAPTNWDGLRRIAPYTYIFEQVGFDYVVVVVVVVVVLTAKPFSNIL